MLYQEFIQDKLVHRVRTKIFRIYINIDPDCIFWICSRCCQKITKTISNTTSHLFQITSNTCFNCLTISKGHLQLCDQLPQCLLLVTNESFKSEEHFTWRKNVTWDHSIQIKLYHFIPIIKDFFQVIYFSCQRRNEA